MLLGFHTLGDDFHPQAVRHADHRDGESGVRRVGGDVAHERAVDLQGVDREPLQIADRRIAGSEIVDGEMDAHFAQRLEGADRSRGIVDEDALGDLELQLLRRKLVVAERAGHRFHQLLALKLP